MLTGSELAFNFIHSFSFHPSISNMDKLEVCYNDDTLQLYMYVCKTYLFNSGCVYHSSCMSYYMLSFTHYMHLVMKKEAFDW